MSNQTFQLPTSKNLDVIKKQIENQKAYQVLKQSFEKQGFEFIVSRAQIYISYDNSKLNINPSMFCIIPSLVPLDFKKDASHKAVGIGVFINNDQYSFIATEVLVNHKPYQIENYSLYILNENKNVELFLSIPKKDLVNNEINVVSRKIKDATIDEKLILKANIPEADFGHIIKNSLSNFLNDEFTKQYPSVYKNSMLKESALIEKFSLAIALKKQTSAAKSSWSCSSTCCNGCTTTSSSWSMSWNKAIEVDARI